MAVYKNSEARKASQQLKPAKKTAIAIVSGSSKTVATKPKAVIKNNQSMVKPVVAKSTPKPTVKPTVKPKTTPAPKFTAPSVAEFRQSAAYKTDSMTYKQYVDTMYQVFQAKNKKR